jgi:hypothetical protein
LVLCAALGATATTSGVVRGPNVRLRLGTSLNWSGYAVDAAPGANLTSVSGSWIQPSVTCGPQNGFSAYWVGLDGDNTSTVEQLGTEADCVGGVAQYSSWYEMYPHRSFPATIAVVPGHTYHASVTYLGGGNFQLTLADLTVPHSPPFTTTQKLMQAKLASAEAIVEAPSNGSVLPLANFGTAHFSGVTVQGATMTSPPAQPINMTNANGATKDQTSGLVGGNFTVTWVSGS